MITNLNKAIKNILMASSMAVVSASTMASVGVQIPPPGPGQIPDYFGVTPNFAESPSPRFVTVSVIDGGPSGGGGTGAVLAATNYDYNVEVYTPGVTDVQVVNGGSGYSNATSVYLNGAAGVTPVRVTPVIVNGTIVSILQFDQFLRDSAGNLTATANPAWVGNNALTPYLQTSSATKFNTPIAGTGIRKFVDALPGLAFVGGAKSSYTGAYNFGGTDVNGNAITAGQNNLGQQIPQATADTTTFPGSDYYVIGEVEYKQKLHSDLPATHLRGYVQLDASNRPIGKPQYLGPIIVAQKDRPVRVKLVNLLSQTADVSGAKGNLTVPVDVTYMAANDTFNRTALHLHGGNTPYISDGTPRQWVKPKGEGVGSMPADGSNPTNLGYNKGVSAANVPDMWFDAAGNLLPNSSTCTQGTITCTTAGATNNPGDGSLTFYFTNQQSARLMFYHDHTEGTTRLNVYAGLAAPYLLQDPTELDLINGTNLSGNNTSGLNGAPVQVLPPLADTIPLIIQEKTFVANETIPVLNFYGAFKSQLNSQDPTWNWGALKAGFTDGIQSGSVQDTNGTGDLWVPHVFMTNQNPGDISGANSVGRWDYGPWFWPPFIGIQHGQILNPYYDPACNSANNTMGWCEGQWIPGIPNGNTMTNADLTALYNAIPADPSVLASDVTAAIASQQTLSSPTGTPEAFNDTPLVNGTVYPYVNVDPKPYRFRILSIADDRAINLSLVVAASKNSDTTAAANTGTNSSAIMCDGTTAVNPADCTEVKMVPFDRSQDAVSPFPAHTRGDLQDNGWYTSQKGGVTFDGRPSGVFDPRTRGPMMVQVGVDGGFLSSPVPIYNKPINYEYNLKNIVVTNVKEHALLLGPAERADVVVDFSNFAGSTILMYNDAPAALPAFDLRLDYYTGDPDNTDTGGTFSTVPGYGPNTRTLLQIRVSNNGGAVAASAHPDDLGVYDDGTNTGTVSPTLVNAIQTAFRKSQEPIIVPQAVYNSTYGNNIIDTIGGNYSRISDNQLTFKPLTDPATGALGTTPVTVQFQPKSIVEDWTQDYGRMTALLGVEMPRTSAVVQTSNPMSYIDAPTEIVKMTPNDATPVSAQMADGTQIWKITHNGVDTHAIHFHLFHVQLINRVGWDGGMRPVELNEMGWKDIIRMNPLEDAIVALRPKQMTIPWKLGNSHHLLDPTKAATADPALFYNFNPVSPVQSNVTNLVANFGYEYLWHCHILGHEENDMMRPIIVANEPEQPTIQQVTAGTTGSFVVNWIDNSMTSNWAKIERASDAAFTQNLVSFNAVQTECASQTGCARSYTDRTAPASGSVYYRVTSMNTVGAGAGRQDMGYNPDGTYVAMMPPELNSLFPGGQGGFDGYGNQTANSVMSATVGLTPVASLLNSTTAFGGQFVNTTSAAQTVTVKNIGLLPLGITSAPTASAGYAVTANNCLGVTLVTNATCTINVTFRPTAAGAANGTLSIPTNDSAHNPLVANLTGTGTAPIASLVSSLAFGNVDNLTTSAAQAIVVSNTGTDALTFSNIVLSGASYAISSTTCATATPVPAGGFCTINVTFSPTAIGSATGALTLTDNSAGVTGSLQVVNLSGAGVLPAGLVVPGATSTPTAIGVTNTALTLNWTAPTTGGAVTSYTVQRATNAGFSTGLTTTTGITTTTLNVTGLTPGVTYYFRVGAVNAAGNGANSATLTQATTVPIPAPAAPTGITSVGGTTGAPITAALRWTAVTGATSYDVMWGTAAQITANTGTIVNNATSGGQITMAVASRTTVSMKVRAVGPGGAGAWSTVATARAQ